MLSLTLEGDREVIKALKKTGRIRMSDLRPQWQQIAQQIAGDAVRFVTVDTGRLAHSIRAGNASTRSVVRAGGKSYGVEYAGVQNYGWPEHDIEPEYWLNEALLGNADTANETVKSGIMRLARRNGLGR